MNVRALVAAIALIASFEPHAESSDYLDTILVIGSRSEQSIAEATSSVTVITRAEIERRQIDFVADLLRTVPGFSVSNAGGIGKNTQIRVRGAEANHVLVLIDGIEANDIATTDGFDFANLTTDGIERIEIVRGPHSAIWGSEAVAGVINIVTRGAEDRFSADFELEGGSFATTRLSASVGGRSEELGLRVSVNRTDSGGTNISQAGEEDDAYHKFTVNVKGDVALRDNLRLDASVRHTSTDAQIDSFDFLTSRPFDTPGLSDTNQSYVGTRLTLDLLDGRWTQKLAGRWTSTENDSVDPAVFLNTSQSGDKYAFTYQSTVRAQTESWWLRNHVLTFALDHELESFSQLGFERNLDVTGYTLEYAARAFDVLSLTGSVRYDRNSDFKNATTFRTAGAWQLPYALGRMMLVYGTGQKDPLFTERFGFSPSASFTFVGNPGLRPERSEGWEVQYRQEYSPAGLLLEAAWFSEKTEDEINGFFALANGDFTAVNLPGTTRRRGVEVALRATLHRSLLAGATYTWIRATDVLDGPRLDKVRVPRHQGAVDLTWLFAAGRGDVNLRVNLSGDQEDFDFSTFPRRRVSLGGRTLVGLSMGYDLVPGVRLIARVENVLDDDYQEILGFAQPGIGGYAGLRISTGGL